MTATPPRPDLRRLRKIAAHPRAKLVDSLVAGRIADGEDPNEATDAVLREQAKVDKLRRQKADR